MFLGFFCLFVCLFVFYQSFLPRKLTTHRTAGKERGREGNHILFHSTTSTWSQTFRHLFATFHVRWLSHIFNCTTCICQTATRWDLPPYRTTTWLIDNAKLVFVCCLLNDLILGFCYSNLDTENRWTRTRNDYHPCITSEPTNQVS